MVLAWFMDDSKEEDQRKPHKPPNCETVSLSQLAALGVLYWKVLYLSAKFKLHLATPFYL